MFTPSDPSPPNLPIPVFTRHTPLSVKKINKKKIKMHKWTSVGFHFFGLVKLWSSTLWQTLKRESVFFNSTWMLLICSVTTLFTFFCDTFACFRLSVEEFFNYVLIAHVLTSSPLFFDLLYPPQMACDLYDYIVVRSLFQILLFKIFKFLFKAHTQAALWLALAAVYNNAHCSTR